MSLLAIGLAVAVAGGIMLIAFGLAAGWLRPTMWTLAALSLLAILIRTGQVVKEERA